MPHVLAIDQSTSATKAILFELDSGRVVKRASRDHRQIYPAPGLIEHDASEIWTNVVAVIDGVLSSVPAAQRPAWLSITNQRETFVIFDRKKGEPLHNAIVWQDGRGEPICAELRNAGHEAAVRTSTGLTLNSYFSASKIAALSRAKPELWKKLNDGSACVSTIDAYLVHRLTGGEVFATDTTNASRTLLFDIQACRWDPTLCDLFAVPMGSLPEVRDSTARFGTVASTAAKGLPIAGVMGDSQAALFAHRCFTPGQAKVTLGTGSSVLLNAGDQPADPGEGTMLTIAWSHANKPTYCYEGVINYSAATIAWLKDQLGLIRDASETEAIARSIPDNGGVYLVPAFAGLGAPYWSAEARAAIVGMSGASGKAQVVRAALESIGYQIRDVLEMMRDRAGVSLKTVKVDGGATRNRFLTQFIADMIGLALNVAEMPECSPLGAAMAGAVAMGRAGIRDLEKLPVMATTLLPTTDRAAVDAWYAGWRRAVRSVLAGTER